MKVAESDIVTVEIITNPQFTQLGVHKPNVTGTIVIEKRSVNGNRARREAQIQVHPIMIADLSLTDTFSASTPIRKEQRFSMPGDNLAWVWDIKASMPGEQTITVNIYGKESADAKDLEFLVQSLSLNITVSDKSIFERMPDAFINAFVALIGTNGILGVILAFLTYKSNKEKQKLELDIKALEKDNQGFKQQADDSEKQRRTFSQELQALQSKSKELEQNILLVQAKSDEYNQKINGLNNTLKETSKKHSREKQKLLEKIDVLEKDKKSLQGHIEGTENKSTDKSD